MVSDLAHALAVLLVVGAAVIVGSTVYMGARAVRFWRRLRTSVPRRFGVPGRFARPVAPRRHVKGVTMSTLTDVTWWANQRDRHSMWRAVSSAERAVSGAKSAGVPIGDLATVTREIRAAARIVDAGLCAGRRGPDLLRQARDLT